MRVKSETLLKALILTRGVEFSEKALQLAQDVGAKRQNRVYNLPKGSDYMRPQEIMITGKDGYQTVVSCVAVPNHTDAVYVDVINNEMVAFVKQELFEDVKLEYVLEPEYYSIPLSDEETVRDYVSSCGLDEMNILPWKGCAIEKGCKFCGVNKVTKSTTDKTTAIGISKDERIWAERSTSYLSNLVEAVKLAKDDDCFKEHKHLILISGNLSNDKLDYQSKIYAEIAAHLTAVEGLNATEGLIAVMMPPKNMTYMKLLKDSGIDIVVFNLEVANEPWFSKYCPGKKEVGIDFIAERLYEAVKVFGEKKVWTNFVLGLEPIDLLLNECEKYAQRGIVSSANVLHLDEGNSLDCGVPTTEDVLMFFSKLATIYKKYDMKPFYCSKALRTSLSNEAYDERICLK